MKFIIIPNNIFHYNVSIFSVSKGFREQLLCIYYIHICMYENFVTENIVIKNILLIITCIHIKGSIETMLNLLGCFLYTGKKGPS